MAQAKNGDTVRVHYTGKLVDGTVFDSSVDREPLEFKIGAGQLIPGFEQAVVGMKPGESISTNIAAYDAYGQHDEDLVWVVETSELPDDLEPEVGQHLESIQRDGRRITLLITEVSESTVTLDANHPLAGKDLVFDIELIEIL
ncbi:MAG: peptidylprolyl isomerase [bacterium]